MMGSQVAPAQLFYDFCLDDHVPDDHLLRRIDQFLELEGVRSELQPFYSTIGRPSVAPGIDDADAGRRILHGHSVRAATLRGGSP